MDHFAGLDVSVKKTSVGSVKKTSVGVVDDTGRIVREVKLQHRQQRLGFATKSVWGTD